ncbi:MAG: molybdopterin-dependent oxidoreductase, partial [Phaeodactylibacter sp.]|nr:molybdopterin-dependent oxidoreductase [Phaeodactylibacter sp.]
IKEGLVDWPFIEKRLEGYDELRTKILALDLDEMEKVCGVNRELAREAAIAYASAPAAMCFHGLGVTEHYQGTFGVMLVADLAMITGNIGRRGVGVNPLRGQNNVQGAADMGVQPNLGPGYLNMADPVMRST